MTKNAPKKTIRRTVRGNVVGYISGKMWMNFGDWFDPHAQHIAQIWLETYEA